MSNISARGFLSKTGSKTVLDMDYLYYILTFIAIYGLLALGLNLILGYTGILSIGHAVFFAIGAYWIGLEVLPRHTDLMINLTGAGLAAGLCSIPLALMMAKVEGDYFAIASLGYAEIFRIILLNWTSLTNGPRGIIIPEDSMFFGRLLTTGFDYMLFGLVLLVIASYTAWVLMNSKFGKRCEAIREDKVFLITLGENPLKYQVLAFATGSSLAGIAGGIYAYFVHFISPGDFDIRVSILVLSMIVIGGLGKTSGAILGAFLLIVLPESLRYINLGTRLTTALPQILAGVVLLFVVRWRPEGLVSIFSYRRRHNLSDDFNVGS